MSIKTLLVGHVKYKELKCREEIQQLGLKTLDFDYEKDR